MCDSTSCSSDFTKYCPVENLCAENVATQTRSQSLKVKSRVAMFSKKPKPTFPLRNQVNIRMLGENDMSEIPSPRFRERSGSCYVSQEELSALQGCVSRRRALFTSDQDGLSLSSHTIPRPRTRSSKVVQVSSDSDLCNCRDVLTSKKYGEANVHKSCADNDHAEGPIRLAIPDTVSVQFRSNSQECIATKTCESRFHSKCVQHCSSGEAHLLTSNNSVVDPYILNLSPQPCTKSSSIPGWLNSPKVLHKCTHLGTCKFRCSSLSRECVLFPRFWRPHDQPSQSACNSWPRNQLTHALSNQYSCHQEGLGRIKAQSSHRYNEKLSPHHQRKESSLLNSAVETEIISSEQNLEIFGSSSSICSVQSQQSSVTNASVCSERPHFHYGKSIDGVEFKRKTDKMISWFSEFNDQQRNVLLQKLLEESDCTQMHFLSLQLEPILQIGCPHNCQDLLSWLPSYITEQILEYLDPVSLCRASQVSYKWYQLATSATLWMNLCKLNQWQLSTCGEKHLINFYTSSCDKTVQWKLVFAEKFRLKRNWLKGYCTVRTFEGHSQGISCIQFDDTRIVSGSWDKTIKVWNRRTNTAWAALTLAGHSGTVRCLHLHGNRLVSGSSDRTIKVWDLSTDKVGWVGAACRATMVGHQHTVRCLQADDSKVISGSYDLTLKVWDIKTGQCTKTLRGHTDAVLCLQFANDDVVSGSKDMTIKVWSLSSGACKLTLHGHQAAVTCVQFDKTKIISGALDTLIKIWSFSNGECIRTMDWIRSEGHTGVIRHLQADTWKIISAADDKTMKVWSVHSGNRLLTLKSHTDGVTCLQFNDKVIVSGSYDKTVKLWDFSAC